MRSTRRAHVVSRGTSARRRKLVWATFDQTIPVTVGTRQTSDLLANLEVAGASTLGITIMRTHIRMTPAGDAVTGGLAYGLIVGRKLDVGPGVGPNALGDVGDDWMWIDRFFPTTEGGQVITSTVNVVIDVRAKRIMQELDQRLLLCTTNTNAAGTQNVRTFARVLVALPLR